MYTLWKIPKLDCNKSASEILIQIQLSKILRGYKKLFFLTRFYIHFLLTQDAAFYFGKLPEHCILKNEKGAIWPEDVNFIEKKNS